MSLLSRFSRFSLRHQATAVRPAVRQLATDNHDAMTGSSYENYSETSKTYDNFRAPIGLEILRKALALNANRRDMGVDEMSMLDAGCGSGSYLQALRVHFESVEGLEFNEGMIAQAATKGLKVTQGSITDMPFADASFDIAITTQVLHHLVAAGGGGEAGFKNIGDACKEVFRCIKPGGAWIVNTQTPEQHVDGFWWAPVVPQAAEALSKNFPEIETLTALLQDAGFDTVETYIPPEPLVREDMYLDIEGPFNQQFRNADSTWALATEEELAEGLKWLRAKIDAGEGEKYLQEREAIRARVGQTTTVVATRK